MGRFGRRYAVQLAALAAAVLFIVVLGVVAFRPSGGGGGGAVVRSPVTARGTATPDPRVDEVKAVVRRYLVAFWESAKTGDTAAVDALTEKDSQAYGDAAAAAEISKADHHTFAAGRVDVDDATWRIDVTGSLATVHVIYTLYGHYADWPSLRAAGPDHSTPQYKVVFGLRLTDSKWLIYLSS